MQPLLALMGCSGSGKSTLCAELEKRYGLKSIPSYTTRKPRFDGEQGHTFITEDEFDKLKDILAYAETDNCRYAVTKEMLEDEQYSIYVIDMTGLKYLYEHYHGDRPIISVFISCSATSRFKHMMDREDSRPYHERLAAAIDRIEHDSLEFNKTDLINHVNYRVENKEGEFDNLVGMVSRICSNYGLLKENE